VPCPSLPGYTSLVVHQVLCFQSTDHQMEILRIIIRRHLIIKRYRLGGLGRTQQGSSICQATKTFHISTLSFCMHAEKLNFVSVSLLILSVKQASAFAFKSVCKSNWSTHGSIRLCFHGKVRFENGKEASTSAYTKTSTVSSDRPRATPGAYSSTDTGQERLHASRPFVLTKWDEQCIGAVQ